MKGERMLTRKPTAEQMALETLIMESLTDMLEDGVGSEDFDQKLKRVTVLKKLKEESIPPRRLPSSEALLAAGVNLLGIALILYHEDAHVIGSKALSFVQKSSR
jgi:hypothetical protein